MRLTMTVVAPATGLQADVVIEADPETVVAEIAVELDGLMHGGAAATAGEAEVLRFPGVRAAASYAGPGIPGYGSLATPAPRPAAPALFVGYHQVPGDLQLADSPIMDGCVVSIGDAAGCRRPEPVGVAEIRVAGGPAAGTLHRLGFGQADIGGPIAGGPQATDAAVIVIADPTIPSTALRVQVDPRGCQVTPVDGVPVLLDRRPLDAAAYWRPGAQVAVGDSLLDLTRYEPPDAALHPQRRWRQSGVQPAAAAAAARAGGQVRPAQPARQT